MTTAAVNATAGHLGLLVMMRRSGAATPAGTMGILLLLQLLLLLLSEVISSGPMKMLPDLPLLGLMVKMVITATLQRTTI